MQDNFHAPLILDLSRPPTRKPEEKIHHRDEREIESAQRRGKPRDLNWKKNTEITETRAPSHTEKKLTMVTIERYNDRKIDEINRF